MKMFTRLFFLALFLSNSSTVFGEPGKTQFTQENIYKHFRYVTSPKETMINVQKAALWLSKKGKSGLKEFDKPVSKWNNLDGYHSFMAVSDCSQGSLVSHPNPQLHRMKKIKNLIAQFKDFSGRAVQLDLCLRMQKNPRGAWVATTQTFIRSTTLVKEPMLLFQFGIRVPGYPWEVYGVLPGNADSQESPDQFVSERNALVNEWSIIN